MKLFILCLLGAVMFGELSNGTFRHYSLLSFLTQFRSGVAVLLQGRKLILSFFHDLDAVFEISFSMLQILFRGTALRNASFYMHL